MKKGENAEISICVIGLGYVGLTLSTVLAESGFKVLGIEKRKEIVELTNNGEPHFCEKGLSESLERVIKDGYFKAYESIENIDPCDIYFITVGTPLNSEGILRLDMIENASKEVASNMKNGSLVIIRSTVKIGTTREVVSPILSESGKIYSVAMCPERTLEGKALQELRELPQIVGADKADIRDRAASIFRKFTNSIVEVSTLETAETIKLVDNTYRDVHFAFANEVARACEPFNVNVKEVISSGNLGYSRTNMPYPGLVGGPCLEKDPHIFVQSALCKGINLDITAASRLTNERQIEETLNFILDEMKRRSFKDDVKVCLLGMAFKGIPETDDMRGSMSLKFLKQLKSLKPNLDIYVYDHVVSNEDIASNVFDVNISETINEALSNASVAIILNNHPVFKEISPLKIQDIMSPGSFIYDYWNNFSNLKEEQISGFYFAVGNIKR